MHRGTITASLVVALLGMSAAAASARDLTLSEGGTPFAKGEAFEIGGRPYITAGGGPIECPEVRPDLEVSVLTNSKVKDELQVDELANGNLGECISYGFYTYAYVNIESIARPLVLRSSGKATAGFAVEVVFEHIERRGVEYHNVECTFKRHNLRGVNNATGAPEQLYIEFRGELTLRDEYVESIEVHEEARPGPACPKTVKLQFTLTPYGAVEEQLQ